MSQIDPHAPEYILTAIGSSSARSLQHFYIDCPSSPPDLDDDEPENRMLSLDLSHCTALRDLWVLVPYSSLGIKDAFASFLACGRRLLPRSLEEDVDDHAGVRVGLHPRTVR